VQAESLELAPPTRLALLAEWQDGYVPILLQQAIGARRYSMNTPLFILKSRDLPGRSPVLRHGYQYAAM